MGIMSDNMNDAFAKAHEALAALESVIPLVKKLEEENATLRADVARRQGLVHKQNDYAVSLQRLVEHLCRGNPIPDDLAQAAPYHGAMAKAKQAEESKDTKRLDAYAKMVQEEYPFTPYYADGYWRYPYLDKGECGFGAGVAEVAFSSFREAIDAALQERFA